MLDCSALSLLKCHEHLWNFSLWWSTQRMTIITVPQLVHFGAFFIPWKYIVYFLILTWFWKCTFQVGKNEKIKQAKIKVPKFKLTGSNLVQSMAETKNLLAFIFFLLGPNTRTTDTQRRLKSKKSEILGRCGRQNMLRQYL